MARRLFPRRLWHRVRLRLSVDGGGEGEREEVFEVQRVVALILEKDLCQLDGPLPPLNAEQREQSTVMGKGERKTPILYRHPRQLATL